MSNESEVITPKFIIVQLKEEYQSLFPDIGNKKKRLVYLNDKTLREITEFGYKIPIPDKEECYYLIPIKYFNRF